MSSRLARLVASVTLLAALFAGTALSKAQPAYAGGDATCSGVIAQVICVGTVGPTNIPVTITLSDINILTGGHFDVSLIEVDVKDVLSHNDIDVNHIASNIHTKILNDNSLLLDICQVKVVEVGQVNTNIAQCL